MDISCRNSLLLCPRTVPLSLSLPYHALPCPSASAGSGRYCVFFAPNVYSIDALVPRCHRHLQQPPDSLGRGFKVSRSTASPQHRSGRQSTGARYAPMSCTPTLWVLRVSFLAMPHPNQDVLTKLHSSQRPALTKAIPSLRHLQDASRSPPQQPGPPFLHTFHVGGKRNPQIQEKETLKSIHPSAEESGRFKF